MASAELERRFAEIMGDDDPNKNEISVRFSYRMLKHGQDEFIRRSDILLNLYRMKEAGFKPETIVSEFIRILEKGENEN